MQRLIPHARSIAVHLRSTLLLCVHAGAEENASNARQMLTASFCVVISAVTLSLYMLGVNEKLRNGCVPPFACEMTCK